MVVVFSNTGLGIGYGNDQCAGAKGILFSDDFFPCGIRSIAMAINVIGVSLAVASHSLGDRSGGGKLNFFNDGPWLTLI